MRTHAESSKKPTRTIFTSVQVLCMLADHLSLNSDFAASSNTVCTHFIILISVGIWQPKADKKSPQTRERITLLHKKVHCRFFLLLGNCFPLLLNCPCSRVLPFMKAQRKTQNTPWTVAIWPISFWAGSVQFNLQWSILSLRVLYSLPPCQILLLNFSLIVIQSTTYLTQTILCPLFQDQSLSS